jgi:uncharacterized Fe-S cluster-containing radical SAM superfamily protein
MRIDPIKRALELRKTLVKGDELYVADFSDTLQGKDTSRIIDLMPNFRTGKYVFRAKCNIKEIDPIGSEEYKTDFFDTRHKTRQEIEDFAKRQEFDFALWWKGSKDFRMTNIADYNLPFILQVAGCNFHDGSAAGGCWYCFVDDKSNDGKPGDGKSAITSGDTIFSMLKARDQIRKIYKEHDAEMYIRVLRVSGGEPTVALDWVLDLWREAVWQDFVGQLDSNLSTGLLVDYFEKEGIYEKNILEKLAEFPVKILAAVKGVDEENLQCNVQSTATMETQLYSIKKFLRAGLDIYPQMYNPNPAKLEDYLQKMDSEIENFSLKIHIGPLKLYGPNRKRISEEAKRRNVEPDSLVSQFKKEWDHNYARSNEVIDAYLQKKYKVGYKDTVRADVALK